MAPRVAALCDCDEVRGARWGSVRLAGGPVSRTSTSARSPRQATHPRPAAGKADCRAQGPRGRMVRRRSTEESAACRKLSRLQRES